MTDATAVIIAWLSNPAHSFKEDGVTVSVQSLHQFIASRSPGAGYNVLDHIQGGLNLPVGYNVGTKGPFVLIDTMPGGVVPEHGRIWPVRVQVQTYGKTDGEAFDTASAVLDVLDGACGAYFTSISADGVPQVIRDDQTEWFIGLTFYTSQIRSV